MMHRKEGGGQPETRNMFKILDEIRKTATETEKCRNPIQTEGPWKKLDGKLMPEWEIVLRPVVKKLWVAGRASEERRVDERCEGPLRKMLRRQRRDFGGARGEGTR